MTGRRAALGGIASGGIVIAHCLAYLIAVPAGGARAAHMASTGHGSFHVVASFAIAATAVALVSVCVRALAATAGAPLARTVAWLSVAQVAGFAALEAAERGFALDAVAADPAVRIGLVLQVVVAALAAAFLRGLERAVRAVAALVHRPRRAREPDARPRRAGHVRLRLAALLSSAPRRAPPLPVAG